MAEIATSTAQGHPLLLREERAYRRLDRFRPLIREAYEYILPRMPHDLDMADDGTAPERPAVTDSTATDAAFAYADRFMTRYTPPNESFVSLRPGIQIEFFAPAIMEQARNLLDQTMEMFHRLLEISNFHQVVHRAYLDYAISTGSFNFNEVPNPNDPFGFEVVPLPQLTPEEGPRGTARTSFRRFRILPQNILATWPDAELDDDLARRAENPTKGSDRVTLVEALVWDERAQHYDYCVIDKGTGKELVRRRVGDGARVIFRNQLPSNSVLGIGPGIRQLPNIRQLNKAIELQSIAQEMDALSVYEAPLDHPMYGQGGMLDLAPGLVIPYGATGGLTPMQRAGGQFAIDAMVERLQGQIRAAFGDDTLPPIGGKVLSPTEIVQRTRNELEQFEPSATRLDAELLRPVTRRGIAIMQRQGIVPNFRIDGLRVKIMADGPLSRLRRQNEARQRLTWASEVAAGLGAEVVLAATDAEGLAADLLSDGGIEPKFVLDDAERAERRAILMREQLMLAQAQAAQQAA